MLQAGARLTSLSHEFLVQLLIVRYRTRRDVSLTRSRPGDGVSAKRQKLTFGQRRSLSAIGGYPMTFPKPSNSDSVFLKRTVEAAIRIGVIAGLIAWCYSDRASLPATYHLGRDHRGRRFPRLRQVADWPWRSVHHGRRVDHSVNAGADWSSPRCSSAICW